MERVVITGAGLVSCLGPDLATVTSSLREGRVGLVRAADRVERGFHSALCGALPGFDPKRWLTRKERRSMGEAALYGASSAVQALSDAGMARDAMKGPDYGVIFGNDSAAGPAFEAGQKTTRDGSTRGLGSSAVVECMTSSPSINVSVLLGSQGASWSVAGACASGAHAVGQSWGLVATGQQRAVLCGGTQELHWASMAGFDALAQFSSWQGDPALSVRPFSRDRMGLVPGGGGAALVVESLSHARARDARIRAEILSYAFASDGHHVTTPTGDGAVRAMRRALDLAGLSPSDVDYINAHATGTPLGDAAEARAILRVFEGGSPPVSSTKALTGHEMWMAGASELIYSMLAADAGFLPVNRNFSQTDEGIHGLDIIATTRPARPRVILSNSFGFGGTNAVILLRMGAPLD